MKYPLLSLLAAVTTLGQAPNEFADSLPGIDIGAKANAAFSNCRQNSGTCVVRLMPGQRYTFSTSIKIPSQPAILDCSGSVLAFQGTGDAIFVSAGPAAPPFLSGGIRNCTILGTSNPRSNGIHQQSRIGFLYDGVAIRNFAGTDSSAIWWETVAGDAASPGWNEQNVIRKMDLGNSTKLFRMSRGTGADSYAYNRIDDLHLDVMDGQVGLSIEGNGTPRSISLIHDEISLRANVSAANRPATVIAVTKGGRIEESQLTVLAEQTAGAAPSYGFYVDATSNVYASGIYAVGDLKTFSGGTPGRLVMVPTINPGTRSVHFEPPQSVIQQRHCKFDLGPTNATFWLASYGEEADCALQILARKTDDSNPDVDVMGSGAAPRNILYADGKSQSIGVGAGFSAQSPPRATLSVAGSLQVGSQGTAITKFAHYDATLSPAAVPPQHCGPQEFAIPGVDANDVVLGINPRHPQDGLAIGGFSVISAGRVAITFCNVSSTALTPAPNETYRIVVIQ
jgi:hypothetical protein